MQLRRCGVAVEDLSMLYKTVIMPVHEYSYPTWHTGLLTQHDSEINRKHTKESAICNLSKHQLSGSSTN